ncbi:single-strand binding protein/primosomal replication protein n [Clostridium aceticum]|uniref:Single-strand binding protein/primosomal replication protein n n=1 Tax=Clostridium aceticum TaxID=84022 RepID=A0A0D8I7C9_9CLOT|nr:single-stranded DNA-binding protein [Clostridium aceticum]AKL94311.1 single-strand binding protein/primosomal replication protein n [Clostridium aceticum]KJF26153.1 single-stranded DNA-binding protein [Clostridium aceticum]
MSEHVINSNMVTLVGKILGEKEFSHEIYGEGFYLYTMEIPRLSDSCDYLPLTVSERLLVDVDLKAGSMIKVEGQLRSYNKFVSGNNKLILTIFARDIVITDNEEEIKNPNQICLDGYICKQPIYRETPFGREITDLLVAVNRSYNKSDYIPCIAWGRNARFSSKLEVGDRVRTWGRIQSRQYQKKLQDGAVLNKVAYEVSISKMERVEEE